MYKTPQKTNEPADIVIYRQGQGILLKETSLLAYDTTTQKILAIGKEAERLLDHPHENVALCCPLHQGAITDFFAASRLFMGLLRMAFGKSPLIKPRIAVCVPPNQSEVEKKAMTEAVQQAGAREVWICDIPADQFIREASEKFPKQYKKFKIMISITKDEPERYVRELLSDTLTYADQAGISRERVTDLLKSID